MDVVVLPVQCAHDGNSWVSTLVNFQVVQNPRRSQVAAARFTTRLPWVAGEGARSYCASEAQSRTKGGRIRGNKLRTADRITMAERTRP